MDGEAGIGKTTLLRAWAGRRTAAGDTVLIASCGPLDRSMPLDALLTALAALLRGLGPDTAADVLGADAALLGPLLNLAPGPRLPPMLADSMLGPAVLYSALVRALGRLAERAPLVVVVDDAHLAGPALPDWLRFAVREKLAVTVVAAARSGEGEPLPASAFVHLGALGRDAAAELVGPGRVDELYARSRGHPLFLTELAQQAAGSELPVSLVESVSARCDELGPAGLLLRTAAVIGPDLDVDLLAAVLGRPAVALLDDAEQAVAKQFLVEADGMFRFRHELVREALAASATAGRAALLHRQAGRVLDRRPGVDPLTVAGHARLGGDLALASRALRDASARAAERHDYAAAETLLDDALRLDAGPDGWLARARVRTLRGRYAEALADVERAAPAGPAALEVGAWASYFGRDFAQAAQFAADGALAADDAATRARCLAAGGRTHHAAGDLAQAELLLGEAFSLAEGADRVAAAGWLGVLRAHQSRVEEALALLRPAARGQIGVEHTSATMHALLFTGHAHALAGRPGPGAGRAGQVHRRGGTAAGPALRRARGELHRLGAGQPGRPAGGAGPPPGGAGGRAGPGHRGRHHRRAGRPGRVLPGDRGSGRRAGPAGRGVGAAAGQPGLRMAAPAQAPAAHRAPGAAGRRRRAGAGAGPRARVAGGRAGRAAVHQRRPAARAPGPPRARRRPTRTRWPRTLTCSTAPRRSRRGGGPATWPATSASPPGGSGPPTGPRGWRGARATSRTGCCARRTSG